MPSQSRETEQCTADISVLTWTPLKKQSFPSCYHTSRAPPRATATDKRDVRRLAPIARVDSDARVTDSATRHSAFATRNSRVHPASHRALTPTPFDASLHASQPVRRHGVRLGSPTHQVGGARGGPRRYVARKRRARAPRRPKTLPRHPRRPDSPTAQHASTFHDVFFLTRSPANPRAPLTETRPRPRNTRRRSVLDLLGRCEAEPAEAVPVPALGTSSLVLSHASRFLVKRLFPKRETDETLERVRDFYSNLSETTRD